jgi:hypothetical protein
MKYLVEIDSETVRGSKLMKYIQELGTSDKDIHIVNEPPLTDEEMALPPTRRVSQATLDAWLKPDENEEGFTTEEVLAHFNKKSAGKKSTKGDEA